MKTVKKYHRLPDSLQDKLVLNTKALEELPNIAQSLDIIRQKKEYTLKIEVIGKELSKLEGVHEVPKMRSWSKKLSVLQAQVEIMLFVILGILNMILFCGTVDQI